MPNQIGWHDVGEEPRPPRKSRAERWAKGLTLKEKGPRDWPVVTVALSPENYDHLTAMSVLADMGAGDYLDSLVTGDRLENGRAVDAVRDWFHERS